ncbi:MAG TPA: hypothetical protein VKW76_13375 [Candidatus Binatia bacterium]|nr:hypothetical protein [Candidatus Binatia bacterium]
MGDARWLKKAMLGAAMLCVASSSAWADVYVHGYYRGNGTYVQPYVRSDPDGNPYNNWSYPGNVNPYTGRVAPGNADTYLYNYYNRNGGSGFGTLDDSEDEGGDD